MDSLWISMSLWLWFGSLDVTPIAAYSAGAGTTPNISDILIGRCEDYRLCLHGEPCLSSFGQVDCEASTAAFLDAVRDVDPCRTPVNAFDTFLDLVPPVTRRGQTMFWSGVSGTNVNLDVAQVSSEFTVLEETYPGYMAGNLSWCGSTDTDSSSGFNYTACPTWRSSDCPNNTMTLFWENASRRLARQAKGKVFVVLNAQRRGGAFNNGSVFRNVEALSLNSTVITNVAIYLIPDFSLPIPNDMYRETCENGTILYLKSFLHDRGFNTTCEEDPDVLMWLQCARFPDSPLCLPYSSATLLKSIGIVFMLITTFITTACTWV